MNEKKSLTPKTIDKWELFRTNSIVGNPSKKSHEKKEMG